MIDFILFVLMNVNDYICSQQKNIIMSKKNLNELIREYSQEVREYKSKLFRALYNYNELDCLTENEALVYDKLKESPSVVFDCRDLLTKN